MMGAHGSALSGHDGKGLAGRETVAHEPRRARTIGTPAPHRRRGAPSHRGVARRGARAPRTGASGRPSAARRPTPDARRDSRRSWSSSPIPIVLNAIALLPEVTIPAPSLNDDMLHYLFIQRASEALDNGENVFDHWLPQIETGVPAVPLLPAPAGARGRRAPAADASARWTCSRRSTWSATCC